MFSLGHHQDQELTFAYLLLTVAGSLGGHVMFKRVLPSFLIVFEACHRVGKLREISVEIPEEANDEQAMRFNVVVGKILCIHELPRLEMLGQGFNDATAFWYPRFNLESEVFRRNCGRLKHVTLASIGHNKPPNDESLLRNFETWIASMDLHELNIIDLHGYEPVVRFPPPLQLQVRGFGALKRLTRLDFVNVQIRDSFSMFFHNLAGADGSGGGVLRCVHPELCSLHSANDRWANVFRACMGLPVKSFFARTLWYHDRTNLFCPRADLCTPFREDKVASRLLGRHIGQRRGITNLLFPNSFCSCSGPVDEDDVEDSPNEG